MSYVGAFVTFAVTWFLALYCLLPVGVRSHEEAGDEVPMGTMGGAPSKPHLKRKAIGATIIAAAITALGWWLIDSGIVSLATIDRLYGTGE